MEQLWRPLTVTFVYCLERLTYLWLIVLRPPKKERKVLGRGWSAFGEAQPTPAFIERINHQ